MFRTAIERARDEITAAYVSLGPEMYPDQDTLWALIAERAEALAEDIDTREFAALLGVSVRRAQAIAASGAVESRRVGRQRLIPRYAAEEYASRDRRAGRPRKA